jgi:glyoxylase-like metal-dependent hydrolase (beta-lactamase superfamily II)
VSSEPSASSPSSPLQTSPTSPRLTSSKLPRLVLDSSEISCPHSIFAFPPNRDTLGGTAYLIVEKEGNILVDCPAWDETNQQFLQDRGVRWLVLTHRSGIGKVREIQQALNCEVVIQEQEAYLLPGLQVTAFQQEFTLSSHSRMIWTSGHSPASACLYHRACGGVLFTGRHLLPDRQGNPVPLRTAKTFHWTRQIRNVQKLLDHFTPETLRFICPGANTGFLRGKHAIDHAYPKLAQLDLQACLRLQPML